MKIIRIKQFFFVCLILSISINSLFSQTTEFPDFTPPSPTAYELGRYGEIPIGMFTGSPNVSIPLIGFKAKNLSIPISLSYNSNGIKVDQLSTKVGLGWNLIAGGIITRTVNQNPDELRVYEHPEIDNNLLTQPWLDYFFDMTHNVAGISQPLGIDGEPDIFNFNFLGRTGRFTFNNQHEIVLLDNISLKVVFDPEGQGGFLITDEQGIKYYFIDNEETRIDAIGGQTAYNNLGHYMSTSWALSKIVTPYNEIVNFEYEAEDYSYVVSESQYVHMYENEYASSTGCIFCTVPVMPPTVSPIIRNWMLVKGKRLLQISTNNPLHGSVHFQYNQSHPEIENYSLLTSITYIDKLEKVIEDIDLSYSTVNNRLFLDKVSFLDPTKTYECEYTDLYQFPSRLSKSKDHWGYYNGKSNSVLYPNLYSTNSRIGRLFASQFGGANMEVDEGKAKKGLLKRITYPTKGYTELEYESNTHNVSVDSFHEEYVQMVAFTDATAPPFAETSKTITLDDVEGSGLVPLTILFGINYQSCSNEPHPDEADRKFFIQIENLTNPNDDNIISESLTTNGLGNSISVNEEDVQDFNYFFRLTKNNDYNIKVSVFYPCLWGELRFSYQNTPSEISHVNKKTGGLRVSKTANYDHTGNLLTSKKYYYAAKDNLDKSSGDLSYDPNYFSIFTVAGECQKEGPGPGFCCSWKATYNKLSSGSLSLLYRSNLQATRYKYVTVSEDADDFSNGGIEYTFKLSPTLPGTHILGIYSPVYSEAGWSWGDGYELEKTIFKVDQGSFKTVYKETNEYKRDPRIDETIYGFKVSRKFFLPCRGFYTNDNYEQQLIIAQDELNVTQYYLNVNWAYLASKTAVTFDNEGESTVESISNYIYDNPLHAQISRTETIDSQGDILRNHTLYPQDITHKTTAEIQLIDQNRIAIPIESHSYKRENTVDKLLSSTYSSFHDWGNGIIEPEKIKTAKGEISTANPLEDRIVFIAYDAHGNVLEASKNDGVHVSYVWGYHKQYPIAKFENFSYASLSNAQQNLINLAIIASDNDQDESTENQLRTALNNLRTGFPDAMVTTFTYDPLVGLTSMTDPRGYTFTYEYDEFNRLKQVEDADENIVSENQYHYKN